jgi:transcriptional regulator with XRE-family HTH domain
MGDTTGARKQLGKRLGLRIAERRKAIDLTQEQLAERLGVDAETISRFERGVTVPALITLDKLAGILKTSVANLLSEASVCPSDQAIRISAWLESLSADDGEFVITQIKALCDHLSQVRLEDSQR